MQQHERHSAKQYLLPLDLRLRAPLRLLVTTSCGEEYTNRLGWSLGMYFPNFCLLKIKIKIKERDIPNEHHKTTQTEEWNQKYKTLHETQMEDNRLGNNYENGLALSIARTRVKAKKRNVILRARQKTN